MLKSQKSYKPLYLSDVLRERQIQNHAQAIRWKREDTKLSAYSVRQDLDPRVGALMTAKGVKYYTHVGKDRIYTEGTPEQLTQLLDA